MDYENLLAICLLKDSNFSKHIDVLSNISNIVLKNYMQWLLEFIINNELALLIEIYYYETYNNRSKLSLCFLNKLNNLELFGDLTVRCTIDDEYNAEDLVFINNKADFEKFLTENIKLLK